MTCGYGPFNYGECGCLLPSLFDCYGIRQSWNTIGGSYAHPGGLVRQPIIVFALNDKEYNSTIESETEWLIEPDSALSDPATQFTVATLVAGFETGSEFVWAVESRDEEYYAVRYNAVTRDEVFAELLDDVTEALRPNLLNWSPLAFATTLGGTGTLTGRGIPSCTASEWHTLIMTGVNTFSRFSINSGGTITFTNASIAGDTTGGVSARFPQVLAPRGWPMAAGRITASGVGQAIVGPVDWVHVSGTTWRLQFSSHSVVFTNSGAITTWIWFDSTPDGSLWAGVYLRVIGSSGAGGNWPLEAVLVINGSEKLKRYWEHPPIVAKAFADQDILGPVHITHPDENGDRYVVVSMTDYDVLPSVSDPDGTPDDPPFIAVVYNSSGTEVWRTVNHNDPVICKTSSDRWLYFTGWEGNNYEAGTITSATGLVRTAMDSTGLDSGQPFWLAKHDGSQFATVGPWPETINLGVNGARVDHIFSTFDYQVPVTGTNFWFGVSSNSHWPKGFHDVVHNNALVEFGIPADATTFVDVLGDGT